MLCFDSKTYFPKYHDGGINKWWVISPWQYFLVINIHHDHRSSKMGGSESALRQRNTFFFCFAISISRSLSAIVDKQTSLSFRVFDSAKRRITNHDDDEWHRSEACRLSLRMYQLTSNTIRYTFARTFICFGYFGYKKEHFYCWNDLLTYFDSIGEHDVHISFTF